MKLSEASRVSCAQCARAQLIWPSFPIAIHWCRGETRVGHPRACAKVALWLRHFQRIGAETARLTLELHLAELARARELSFAHGQIGAGVQAEHYRGKVSGLYADQMGLTRGPSDDELLRAIERVLGVDAAEAISASLSWDQV